MTRLSLMDVLNKDIINGCFVDKTKDLPPANSLGLDKTASAAAFAGDYASNLFTPAKSGTLNTKCKGKLGNKYLLKYGTCKTEDKKDEKTYKIVDNVCDYGLIGCIFGSVWKTSKSSANLVKNVFNFKETNCKELKKFGKNTNNDVEFHVKKNGKMQTGKLNREVYVVEDFENLYNNVINHLGENNYNNEYNEYLLNNISEVNEKILVKNDFISETYYVLLIIFLLFITYKITNKK